MNPGPSPVLNAGIDAEWGQRRGGSGKGAARVQLEAEVRRLGAPPPPLLLLLLRTERRETGVRLDARRRKTDETRPVSNHHEAGSRPNAPGLRIRGLIIPMQPVQHQHQHQHQYQHQHQRDLFDGLCQLCEAVRATWCREAASQRNGLRMAVTKLVVLRLSRPPSASS